MRSGVAERPESGVEADLVAAPVDPPDQSRDPRVVEEVEPTTAGVHVVVGEEVEGAAQAVPFADRHQEVERVVRIAVESPAPGVGQGPRPPEQQARVPPTEHVAGELAGAATAGPRPSVDRGSSTSWESSTR